MRMIEALSQFIVPLIFLIVWAITSLLNRDSQPLPQRPNRPGAGPGGAGSNRRRDALTASKAEDDEPAVADSSPPRRPGLAPFDARTQGRPLQAPTRPTSPRSNRPNGATGDDEVVFIESARRSIGGSASPPSPRKPARGRRAEPTPARTRRGEPVTQRALSEQVGQSLAQNRSQPLGLSPISANLSSLSSASLRDASSTAARVTPNAAPPALSAAEVRRMMADGARLREMAVLVELLQPPVSRRPRRLG
ncbi:hypothetical protein [Paludisphaera rhizosphaerae]|uniref:hypothetical protein n=1 Tax=Paludisphaera rhizosphaerae TaxID=2711216 RepID=UPI0013EB36F5|nr:hypothetical protein [Paludisphaera rhizosphaerae]